ncbi:hypothetical protein ACFQAV_03495 [Companilactobacillus huachuanensis]|uniref:YtxH domain-containing protein n=1 Tax=Companilactobacillus huachuanensis TaxID=2559914 RepID=A0ABW1RN45_9LACO|nr:hypothetical protein [Companilactobacillus huachuanensis]
MKFFAGFMVGSISGVAIHLFQSKDATSSINNTKIFKNIKDFKDILADLQKNSAIVPEVLSGIQKDVTEYTESIKPDVEELQNSIQEMQENVDKFQK